LLPLSRCLIYLASLFGTSKGGVIVEVHGAGQHERRTMSLSVVSESRGEIIPAILPSIAAQMVLNNEIATTGIVRLSHWLSRERFVDEMEKRQVAMWKQTEISGRWIPNS